MKWSMERCCTPTCTSLPVVRTAFTTSSPCSGSEVIGFSQKTSLPACNASTVMRECHWSVDATMTVNVLAGVQRVHRHARVPLVGRCDDDGVHVFPLQYLAVVRVLLHFGAGEFLLQVRDGFAPAHIPGVADGDKLGPASRLCHAHQVLAASTTADGGDASALVRPQDSGGRGRGKDKASSSQSLHRVHTPFLALRQSRRPHPWAV